MNNWSDLFWEMNKYDWFNDVSDLFWKMSKSYWLTNWSDLVWKMNTYYWFINSSDLFCTDEYCYWSNWWIIRGWAQGSLTRWFIIKGCVRTPQFTYFSLESWVHSEVNKCHEEIKRAVKPRKVKSTLYNHTTLSEKPSYFK